MRFYIFTTGCKANQWDSHVIEAGLKEQGFTHGPIQSADLVIINACSLTGRAETDARRFVQKARQLNGEAKIALVGCHAQAYPNRNFGADLVLGQEEKFEVERYLPENGCHVAEKRDVRMERAAIDGVQRDRTRFFFKIQDGCNKFCSYCVVPYARGASRSRPAEEIAATMKALRDQGIKEAVLTGIDVAAYRDPASGKGFKELLMLLETVDTPPRLRLSSVDPEYIDDGFVSLLASSAKLARSIHIPVQSGCDRILSRMGRRHGSGFVRDVVARLTSKVAGIGVGMDIMVGFPGEDDEAFSETYEFIDSLDIYYLHIFPYSEREGTRAADLDGRVAESVKRSRAKKLKALDARKREVFSQRFVGQTVTIIPEGRVHGGGLMKGFSDNYLPVYVPYEKRLENNLMEVTIRGLEGSRLIGGTICL